MRGHLEVINSVALEGNADFATSTKSFGEPSAMWNVSAEQKDVSLGFPSNIPLFGGAFHYSFASQALCQASFRAQVCLSLGVFWATERAAGVAEHSMK